ncbi:MAG: hypothetical protein LAQ69_47775 [Acidobacteriia bacterium]|nr:hypothetical protein [Terriglobia bacterium]
MSRSQPNAEKPAIIVTSDGKTAHAVTMGVPQSGADSMRVASRPTLALFGTRRAETATAGGEPATHSRAGEDAGREGHTAHTRFQRASPAQNCEARGTGPTA